MKAKLIYYALAVLSASLASQRPADAAPKNVRIVDFGADLGSGDIFYRGKPAQKEKGTLDRDKNGSTDNDTTSFWPFSLSEPLNPTPLRYDADQKSARFYGGLALHAVNNPQRTISEGHMNSNHAFVDDLNFMGGLAPHLPNELVEAYALWIWLKPDFWNGGDKRPVSFDKDSLISVHISRYFGGFHSAHWVVRDGAQFYVSKASFGRYASMSRKDEGNTLLRKTYTLRPSETEWAEYNPAPPHLLDFDPSSAKFAPRRFSDVTAVGWLIRRELSKPERVYSTLKPPFAVKWSAFRCDAVVGAPPDEESYYVPMVRTPSGPSLSQNEITYKQWMKVWRSAVTNQYCYDLGDLNYTFSRDGAVGAMRADDAPHSAAEPVTDIEWIDAATFCNALSELEGRTPCYYLDPEFKQVLRRPIDRATKEKWEKRPTVHWNRKAEGYRLPTHGEWAAAAGKPPAELKAQPSTQAAKTGDGLQGMFGNVWEYVWEADGDSIAEDAAESHTVLGGDFQSPAGPPPHTLCPFPERPYKGHYGTGFRIARGAFVSDDYPASHVVPLWTVRKDTVLTPERPMDKASLAKRISEEAPLLPVEGAGLADKSDFADPVENPDMKRRRALEDAANQKFLGNITEEQYAKIAKDNALGSKAKAPYALSVGKGEVPYRIWKLVKAWAEDNGYSFDHSGDMGSMRHSTDEGHSHSQSEPVTFVSWHDALVWCNALSEISGKEFAYFNDAEKKQPYKRSLLFRLDMFDARNGGPVLPWEKPVGRGKGEVTAPSSGSCVKIFFDGAANGFRLPTNEEFARVASSSASIPAELEWTSANSKDQTQAVGAASKASPAVEGLRGNVLEWGWDSDTQYFQFQNSMYQVNGDGYFYEDVKAKKKKSGFYTDYTANAKPFIGFRIAAKKKD